MLLFGIQAACNIAKRRLDVLFGTRTHWKLPMSSFKHPPGTIRDAIVDYLNAANADVSVAEITRAVEARLGPVSASSVRSYLRLRSDRFQRIRYGRYQLKRNAAA